MRTMIRRTVAVATAAVLAVSLAACGSGDDASGTTDPSQLPRDGAMAEYGVDQQFTATEPLTFSTLYSDHPNYPLKDDWLLWKEIKDRTNVTLEPTIVPMSDYEQKRSLLIGAGDAPMIIPKTYPGQEIPFVSSGAILPVSDYVDLMPNYQDKVAKWHLEPELDTIRQQNGKYYILPGLHEAVWQDYTIAFRTDELQRLGLSEPKTWDDLYTVLKAIKQAHPDSYPLSDRFKGQNLLGLLSQSYGTSAGWAQPGNVATFDQASGKFVYAGATPQYKAMVEYLQKLVNEGLLDPESFTQDDDTAIQKFSTGKSFAISSNAQNIVNDLRPGIAGIEDATVAKIRVPAGPAGDVLATSRLENGIMISAKALDSPNFVAMMQFIDWLYYSDEGEEFAKWGVQPTTFTKDADGVRTLNPNITFAGINAGAPQHLQKDFGFMGGNFAYGGSTELLQSMFTPEELEFQKAVSTKEQAPLPPPHPFDDAEQEQAALYETPLKDTQNSATLQFILGQRDMSTWDAYVAELQGKGMDSYVDLVNTAYERFKQQNG